MLSVSMLALIAISTFALPSLAFAQAGLLNDPNNTGGNPFDLSGNSLTSGTNTSVQGFNTQSTTTISSTNSVSCSKNFIDFVGIIDYVVCTISRSIIPLLFAIALLVFTYGVLNYVIAADGSDKREEGRWFMIYGVIGLFVMVAVWGLVALVSNTLGIGTAFPPQFQ